MINIAIDGPAGAGKSTIAKAVAKRLGYVYMDTGALYRTIAYTMTKRGVPLEDSAAICKALPSCRIEVRYDNGIQRVFADGEDTAPFIRTPEMSEGAAAVAKHSCVRDKLVELQREIASRYDIVMDGRDIGTVVLPGAQVKIYLTASTEERAGRRYLELRETDAAITLEQVIEDVRQRDLADMTRTLSPLKQADDAILADTTGFALEHSIDMVVTLIQDRLEGAG